MKDYSIFLAGCKAVDLPEPLQEYQFAKVYKRKWKTDFLFIQDSVKVAVEVEGGAWTNGRHTRGAGFIADMHKYNCYTILGIKLLRFTPQQIIKEPIFCAKIVKDALENKIDFEYFKNKKS